MCEFHSIVISTSGQIAHIPSNSHSGAIAAANWSDNGVSTAIRNKGGLFEAEWNGRGDVPPTPALLKHTTRDFPNTVETVARAHYEKLWRYLSGENDTKLDKYFEADVWLDVQLQRLIGNGEGSVRIKCDKAGDATHVDLSGCTGLTSVPAFPNATHVDLSGCTGLTSVPAFPNATHVYLHGCTGLTSVPAFPNATHLYLSGCTGLTSVPAFPNATYVDLYGCTGLTSVPAFPNATHVYLYGCTGLTSVPAFPNATHVYLSGCTGLTSVPAFPNATYVDLSGCTGLTSVSAFPNATHVYLHGCTGLTSVPAFPNATYVNPYGCTGLTSVPAFPNATHVDLSGCTGLTSVPAFPNATHVYLHGCTGLTSVPAFPNATHVYLYGCTGLTSVPAFPNATYVDLSGCTGLTSVPAFPNATHVYLSGCTGLTSVPAFPNATHVDLHGCTGLTSVPASTRKDEDRTMISQSLSRAIPAVQTVRGNRFCWISVERPFEAGRTRRIGAYEFLNVWDGEDIWDTTGPKRLPAAAPHLITRSLLKTAWPHLAHAVPGRWSAIAATACKAAASTASSSLANWRAVPAARSLHARMTRSTTPGNSCHAGPGRSSGTIDCSCATGTRSARPGRGLRRFATSSIFERRLRGLEVIHHGN